MIDKKYVYMWTYSGSMKIEKRMIIKETEKLLKLAGKGWPRQIRKDNAIYSEQELIIKRIGQIQKKISSFEFNIERARDEITDLLKMLREADNG
jgi:hypothetical protein